MNEAHGRDNDRQNNDPPFPFCRHAIQRLLIDKCWHFRFPPSAASWSAGIEIFNLGSPHFPPIIMHVAANDTNPKCKRGLRPPSSLALRVGMDRLISNRARPIMRYGATVVEICGCPGISIGPRTTLFCIV